MKWFLIGVALTAGGGALAYKAAGAHRGFIPYPSLIRLRPAFASLQQDATLPQVAIGPVPVGGMSVDEAEKVLRVWWESEKMIRRRVVAPGLNLRLPDMKASELGVTIDDVASVRNVLDRAGASDAAPDDYPIVLRETGMSLKPLEARLAKSAGAPHPARVRYEKGAYLRTPEVVGAVLDEEALPASVAKAVLDHRPVELPMKMAGPKISPAQLEAISDVVASYTTQFSTSKRTRCSNIKLAAHIIDGTVVMPGERFSFNDVVGRRTLKAGFKVAGVYINGQHDTGIGGGICQVSTTLYNAALLSDLTIHRRSNHSLPVPYVPLGRDATVDYGNLDLVFENPYPTPIAISSEYHPGALTFRILGKKPSGMSVKIIRGPMTWVPRDVEQVNDPTLPIGVKRVVKPGSSYRSVRTIRVVYVDGKVVKREPLGRSTYGGQTRVIAVGTKAASLTPIPNAPVTTVPVASGGG